MRLRLWVDIAAGGARVHNTPADARANAVPDRCANGHSHCAAYCCSHGYSYAAADRGPNASALGPADSVSYCATYCRPHRHAHIAAHSSSGTLLLPLPLPLPLSFV